jgi:hypothetical protein
MNSATSSFAWAEAVAGRSSAAAATAQPKSAITCRLEGLLISMDIAGFPFGITDSQFA